MAFAGYWIKIGGNNFTSPAPSKYSMTKNVLDVSAERVASGILYRQVAPHKPYKCFLTFPPMTEAQWQTYFALLDNETLSVEFYDKNTGNYRTANMYCNELTSEDLNLGKTTRWNEEISFNLIEY